VKSGAFDLDLSYDVPTQASNMAASIKWLLQNPGKTGTAKGSIYTTLIPITKPTQRPKAPAGSSARADSRVDRTTAPLGPAPVEERWTDTLTRWRYRYWPDHALGEILAKRWMETAIPVIVLLLVAFALAQAIPNFLSPAALADTGGRRARSASSSSAWPGHDRRRHRPLGRLDVRADEFLRPLPDARAEVVGRAGGRRPRCCAAPRSAPSTAS
jgi:hypothetical protein